MHFIYTVTIPIYSTGKCKEVVTCITEKTGVYAFTPGQNQRIQEYHIEILNRAKNTNNSNEMSVVIRLDLPDQQNDIWLSGSVNEVKFDGTYADFAIRFAPYRTIFIMHNHPSTQNFSYSDIMLFAINMSVYGITVVTNTGETHILCKTEKFEYQKFKEFICIMRENIIEQLKEISDTEYKQKVIQETLAKEIVKYSEKLGLYYKHGGGTHGR